MSNDPQSYWAPRYGDYTVLDLETTINAPHGFKFKADPRYENNKIVVGILMRDGVTYKRFAQQDLDNWVAKHPGGKAILSPARIVVGHNLKFDAQYMGVTGGVIAWDTGIAHYMLTGQKAKFPSLEEVAAHYGLGGKSDPLKKLWEMGFKTEDMDPEFLAEYCKRDAELTHAVYQKQLEATAKTPHMRRLIAHISTASLALSDAEMTGLPVHIPSLKDLHSHHDTMSKALTLDINDKIRDQYRIPATIPVTATPSVLGRVLFMKPLEFKQRESTGRVLKSGKVSKVRRWETLTYSSKELGYLPPAPVLTASKQTRVDDDVLAAHEAAGSSIAWAVRKQRTHEKLVSTYTAPALDYMNNTGFSAMHTTFNSTSTNTGRTSSTNPNVQNLPPEVEACLRAPNGKFLVKADFAQLQICGLAMVSKDKKLMDDVNNDVDVHFETGKKVYGWKNPSDMDKASRRIVKNVNFGLIFGGSAGGLAKQTGVAKDLVQQLIDAFAETYPKAYAFGKDLAKQMNDEARPAEGEFIDGNQVREAFTMTPSGRLLRFVERVAPDWLFKRTKKALAFSPNEISNYPIQGYTDGDLAQQFLGFMFYKGIRIINLVHDAYWFLTDDPRKLIMKVNELLEEFNDTLKLSVPLRLDFTIEDHDGNKVEKM